MSSHKIPSTEEGMGKIEHYTRGALALIYQAPLLTLVLCCLMTGWAGWYATGLKLKTKIQDLLPENAPSLKASASLNERLGSVDMLVVTLLSEELDRVRDTLPQIAQALENLEDVDKVVWRQDITLIEKNALTTFATLDELKDAYQELSEEIQRKVSERMNLFDEDETNRSSTGILTLWPSDEELGQNGKSLLWAEWEGRAQFSEIGRNFKANESEYPEYFYNNAYNTIGLKVYPAHSSNDIAFCQRIVEQVETVVRQTIEKNLGQIGPEGIVQRIDLGGSYRHLLKEANKIKGDMLTSTLASFALLALVLIIAFRSIRGFVCVMLPLLMGTVWTMGLTALFVGYMNLITAFIFAVLLGLGIDFGIHFYGRYREELALGHGDFEAMVQTHLSCGHASLLASSTTIASFLALTLADFKGLSQFGGVAAMGVSCCLIAVLIVLPAIAFAWARVLPLKLLGYQIKREESYTRIPFPLRGRAALMGILLGCFGLALAPYIQTELNFNQLGPHPQPIQAEDPTQMSYKNLQLGTTKATSPTVILASSAEEARALFQQVEELKTKPHSRISSAQSLFSLIPEQQQEKITWVKRLCRKLKRKVKLFEGDERAGAEELLRHCDPAEFTAQELPVWVKDKFTDKQGEVGSFVFISPRGSTSDGEIALDFHAEMQQLKTYDGAPPVVAGRAMVWAEVLMAIEVDGPISFGAALLVVLLLVWFFERSWIGVLFVSAPLTLGLGITIGFMVLLDIKLNFFNMLALPTLIGMGVDDGVHMHHRYRELGRHSARYIVKTTGFSAMLTTLTTSIGFASLMLTDHRGLNSLGLVSVIGMCAALGATLLIVPALFCWWDDRLERREHRAQVNVISMLNLSVFIAMILSFSACDSTSIQSFPGQGVSELRDMGFDPLNVVQDMKMIDQGLMDRGGLTQDQNPPMIDMMLPIQRCQSPCDCLAGLDCIEGHCEQVSPPVYCCRQQPCPQGEMCRDEQNHARSCGVCSTACDCPIGQGCEDGLCVLAQEAVFCCDRSPCPTDAPCEGPQGSSTCEEGCQSACDCWRGQACIDGRCQDRPNDPAFCCERTLCPQGASCEHDDRSEGVCPVKMCVGACDCPTGQACIEGQCELSITEGLVYCCASGNCPLDRPCDTLEGMRALCQGPPECQTACDCPTGFMCLNGRCEIPPLGTPLTLCCEKDECRSGLLCQWSTGVENDCP